MFNITLKLNLKKTTKLFFVEKNESQISGFIVVKKAPGL